MDEVFQDEWGNYFDRNGQPLSLFDLIARGIDVVGAWSSRSPYYSPDDPRYQQRGGYGYPQQYPGRTSNQDFNVGGSVDPRTGIRLNTQLSPWAIGLIAGGAVLLLGGFLTGRGRR